VSFAPQGNREVLAIFSDEVSTLIRVNESGLKDFCEGLSKVLKGYHEMGVGSFNMTVFSGPNDRDLSDCYLLNAKLISRPNFEPFYTGDDGFMEKFHYEPIIEARPEDIAEGLRDYFQG
jgi:galactose-1-phosphate uridylyltransferase